MSRAPTMVDEFTAACPLYISARLKGNRIGKVVPTIDRRPRPWGGLATIISLGLVVFAGVFAIVYNL